MNEADLHRLKVSQEAAAVNRKMSTGEQAMNSGDKNSGERKGTRLPAKEVIRTPAELIKENYGIKEIMYLLNPV